MRVISRCRICTLNGERLFQQPIMSMKLSMAFLSAFMMDAKRPLLVFGKTAMNTLMVFLLTMDGMATAIIEMVRS